MNVNWYKSLFKGKYMPVRIFQLIVDILVFLAMIGLMVSGIMLSRHVFSFLHMRGHMSFARLLHMAASHWGFVLMALHLGLHWGMFLGMAKKALKPRQALPPAKGSFSHPWRGYCRLWPFGIYPARLSYLYAAANPFCISGLQRAGPALLFGLSS